MKRVCIIVPPSPFLLDERVFPFLGPLKVATALERAGHPVDVLDLGGVTGYEDAVRSYLATEPGAIYGVTATSPQMPAAKRILELLGGRAILGGPHATLVAAAAKGERKRNMEGRAVRALHGLAGMTGHIVAGDGERAIFAALNGGPKLIDADDPGTELFLTHRDFAESGWPARHLIDLDSYHYSIDGVRAASLISQLGCPFRCSFCAGRNSPMLRRIRLRSPEDAVAEMVHLYERYGLRGCMFLDDELNVNRAVLPLMRGLKQAADGRGIEWRLRGFIKSELFTDEQAEAMYAAGFRQILIGFEAGDPQILLNIQKNATIEDNTRAISIAHRAGLKVKALMSIGHPGESERTVLAIRDWLLKVKPSDFDVTIITPYPGCNYYDEAVEIGTGVYRYTAKSGDKLYMHDVDFTEEACYYKGAVGSYVSHVWTPTLTAKRMVELRDQVETEVRERLNIPWYAAGQGVSYEHSTGAGLSFMPKHILNRTAGK